jgi:hypothetical protein
VWVEKDARDAKNLKDSRDAREQFGFSLEFVFSSLFA